MIGLTGLKRVFCTIGLKGAIVVVWEIRGMVVVGKISTIGGLTKVTGGLGVG